MPSCPGITIISRRFCCHAFILTIIGATECNIPCCPCIFMSGIKDGFVMKRLVALCVALVTALAVSAPVSARGREAGSLNGLRYEVRLGWGGYPAADVANFVDMDYGGCFGSRPYSSIYDDYSGPVYMTGVISAEFDFVLRRWFTLSLGIGWNGIWGETRDGVTSSLKSMDSGYVATFLPQARFTYFSREYFKMYSAVGLGLSYGHFRDKAVVSPCFHTVPFGIMAGGRVFGFAELALGMLNIGATAGIGVRF